MQTLMTLCRPGFEKECVAALDDACTRRGLSGYGRAAGGSGFASYVLHECDARALLRDISLDELIFARDLLVVADPLAIQPPDRLASLRVLLDALPPIAAVQVAAPDTNEGRELAALCRQLEKPLAAALRQKGLPGEIKSDWRCVLFLPDGGTGIVGLGSVRHAPPWPLGVPRLKLSREAPSRSALKLEEAWHLFIPRDQWGERLRPGMLAVDLGAAPGGWTWQLTRRGMRVDAVDNGPLAPVLNDDPRVTHHRADGFSFRPKRPVDWLVCDMVEKPAAVTALVGRWLVQRLCRQVIFNLKLPMKQRYREAQANLARLAEELDAAGLAYELRARQLYHDREEITVYVAVSGRAST
ncbi:MAG: 23S rRNA (cytidine(2498)-2'-O)-methyltransferase RlmM [Gammaproteobacteria bacterium]